LSGIPFADAASPCWFIADRTQRSVRVTITVSLLGAVINNFLASAAPNHASRAAGLTAAQDRWGWQIRD